MPLWFVIAFAPVPLYITLSVAGTYHAMLPVITMESKESVSQGANTIQQCSMHHTVLDSILQCKQEIRHGVKIVISQ